MKTASVSELSSYLSDVAIQSTSPGAKSSDKDTFSRIMSDAAAAGSAGTGRGMDAGSIGLDAGKKSISQGRSAASVNENGRVRQERTKDPDRKEINDSLDKAAGEVRKELKEKLGVSDEELDEAMEVLGLTAADLFDPAALTQLFAKLSGAGDPLSLLTDEALYSSLQDVLADVQTLTEELKTALGITDEQLEDAVRAFDVSESTAEFEQVVEEDAQEVRGTVDVREEEPEEVKADENAPVEDVRVSSGSETRESNRGSGRHSSSHEEGGQAAQGAYTPVAPQDGMAVAAPEATEGLSYSDGQVRDIARQLVEQIRVNINAQTTSLEMELNPASLGHVSLNIESRNGVITAAFTAQNEAVRAVIENQMIVLRENLESQGIKVEAVEVTVASRQFEENLEGNRDEQNRREDARGALRASGRRMRINLLSGGEEEEEELTPEEEINRDMMIRSGNSMDVTA